MPPSDPLLKPQIKRKSSEIDDENVFPRKRPSWNGPMMDSAGPRYWMVQWRNPQSRKHKTWEGDGYLQSEGEWCSLYDSDGKFMGRGKRERPSTLRPGEELHIGGKDVSIDSVMNATEFQAAVDNRPNPVPVPVKSSTSLKPGGLLSNIRKPFTPLRPSNNGKATSLLQGSTKPVLSDPQYPPSKARVHVTELFEDEGEPIGEKSKAPKGPRVDASFEGLWSVNWRKANTKKNKTWDGDGIVHQKGTIVRFMSDDMKKVFGSKTWDTALDVGSKLWIGEKEIEVDAKLPLSRLNGQFSEEVIDLETREEVPKPGNVLPIGRKFTAPAIVKQVERQENVAVRKPKPIEPLHDPTAPNAIVMKSPSTTHQQRFNPKQRPIVPVVIDPLLGAKLRPHQIEGVKFMYEAVMGMRAHEGQGCILADEMGLGKTLQTIALVWTLLKQNPYAGSGPVIGKAMIVCPVSLVENWRKEFHKWIGRDRIGVFTGNCSKVEIKQFINSRIHQVLIIGYERLRGIIQDLAYCNPPIGLVVCDEGHRLKSAGSKTAKMFTALRTPKRIILSGTPIQNDLSEFHAMADFCNPGVLDDYPNFKRTFENPIIASRMPDCSSNTLQKGRDKAEQLQLLSKSFVLRREATILSNYLPPKYEYVVFVSPTELQLAMITHLLHPDNLHRLTDSTAKSLALIQTLSKLCNSPYLLKKKAPSDDSFSEAIRMIPAQAREDDVSLSGKLTALGAILKELLATTSEKCIIVSHYTSTLDIIEAFCRKQRYKLFRLDGRTPQVQRQELVDKFNKSSQSESYLFLLSAKAGGVGLNLIGASRLVLVDGDWNPSHDLQAMARIHRDGQKRPVYIYRLLTAGTIDEKIFQRQITKIGLSEAMMGNNASSSKSKTDSFTSKELRDLFSIHPHVVCHTHDLLGCPCSNLVGSVGEDDEDNAPKQGRKFVQLDSDEEDEEVGFVRGTQVDVGKISKKEIRKKREALSSLAEWTHINCTRLGAANLIRDQLLGGLIPSPHGHGSKKTDNEDDEDEDRYLWEVDEKEPLEAELAVQDLPGGTMTFVFERVSKTGL